MAKLRKESLTMSMYMDFVKDGDIREDADVQRASGQWTKEQINELIVTVLTDGYIPPIFIGEDFNLQKWLLDGLQRTTSLRRFRFGNYKISSAVRNSVIEYREKTKDENGNPVEDENGDYIWKDCEFNIKNKTYDELPDELKKQFNKFQIDIITFEECTMAKMSDLILIYNNHTGMNAAQKAVTYISEFARNVKDIVDRPFFVNYSNFTENEKTKGVVERAVLETVMCMFHIDKWKKQTKQIAQYLNENSSKEEFEKLDKNLHRLENIITNDVKDLFNSKNCFIWLTLFNRFVELGIDDIEFLKFLHAFKAGLKDKSVDGQAFEEADKIKSTKDKTVVTNKLHILESLMKEFLCIKEEQEKQVNVESFIAENLDIDVERVKEDMDLYNESLDTLLEDTVRIDSKLRNKENRPSLLAMMVYSYKEDVDLDEWMAEYAKNNNFYYPQQEENFLHMKHDFDRFIINKEKKSA